MASRPFFLIKLTGHESESLARMKIDLAAYFCNNELFNLGYSL